MKLTKSKLKQIIKEELKESEFSGPDYEDTRTAVARVADQLDGALEAWTRGGAREDEMKKSLTSIAQDLRRAIENQ